MMKRLGFGLLPAALWSLCICSAYAAPSENNRYSKHLSELHRIIPDLSKEVLSLALRAADCASELRGREERYLTVIDYSLPSTQKRFWVLDLDRSLVLHKEFVAHGKGSGENFATRFSNEAGSLKTSLGLFETGDTYVGQHGYSLYLHGLEPGINDNAFSRAVVIHGAAYVGEAFAKRWNRMGRSWGCPALAIDSVRPVIDHIRSGTLLFSYYPDKDWLGRSRFLNGCKP